MNPVASSSELCRRRGRIPERSNHPSMARSNDLTTPAMMSRSTWGWPGHFPCSGSRIRPVLIRHREPVAASSAPVVSIVAFVSVRTRVRNGPIGGPMQIRRPRTPGTASLRSWLSSVRVGVQAETTLNSHAVADPKGAESAEMFASTIASSGCLGVWSCPASLQTVKSAGSRGRTVTLWKMSTRRRSPGSRERP